MPRIAHATAHPEKYTAATTPKNLQDAEKAARGFNAVIQDPKRDGRQLYLKNSKEQKDVKFLSTEEYSPNERPIDWVFDSRLSQSEHAQASAQAFAQTLLTEHPDPGVQQAAQEVFDEATTGRATVYGGISSSHDLRRTMNALVVQLNRAKALPQHNEPKPAEPAKPFPSNHRSYTRNIRAGRGPAPKKPQPDPVAAANVPAKPSQQVGAKDSRLVMCMPHAQDWPKEVSALTVHNLLCSDETPRDGVLYLRTDTGGNQWVGVRHRDAEIAPEVARAEREAFAQYLHTLCTAYLEDSNPAIRRLAQKGIELASFGADRDLPNTTAVLALFKALARVEAAPKTASPHAPGQAVTGLVSASNPKRFRTAGQATARNLCDVLKTAPSTHVLHTDVLSGAALTSTHAPGTGRPASVGQEARASREGADLATCRMLYQLAQQFNKHPDARVRQMAETLQALARASVRDDRAIPNHPNLRLLLSVLAQAAV